MEKIKTIKIEKGIRMPVKVKYPFRELNVGESFVYGNYDRSLHQKCSAMCHYYSSHLKLKFRCRKDDNGKLRVWRIDIKK